MSFYPNTVDPRVKKLKERDTLVQKSKEWLQARKDCITASDVDSLIPYTEKSCKTYIKKFNIKNFNENSKKTCNPYQSSKQFINKKSAPLDDGFTGNVHTEFGQQFEPVAAMIYRQMCKTDVFDFGLLVHPDIPWLGASPDGITSNARMLEIKCPTMREVTDVIPLHYYHQILLQLEVCQLDVCDFFDTNFLVYHFASEWFVDATVDFNTRDLSNVYHKFGLFVKVTRDDGSYHNIYPPVFFLEPIQFLEWGRLTCSENSGAEVVYYVLEKYHLISVDRDPDWLINNKDHMERAWKEVLRLRKENL